MRIRQDQCMPPALLVGVAVAMLCAGCASMFSTATPADAERAFEAIYPGFSAISAESSGSVWMVRGYAKIEPDHTASVLVEVPISRDGTGPASAVVDGTRWSGTADLQLLVQPRLDSDGVGQRLSDQMDQTLYNYLDVPWHISDVRRASDGALLVSVVADDGSSRTELTAEWDEDNWYVESEEDAAEDEELWGSEPAPPKSSEESVGPRPGARYGDIAFVRADDIWRVHPDGTGATRLTSGAYIDSAPAWSPDRTKIAFVRFTDELAYSSSLCIVAASGGPVQTWKFKSALGGLCFSPDGRRIALTDMPESKDVGRVRVGIFDVRTHKTTYLARDGGLFSWGCVSWSPDGKRLLVGQTNQDLEDSRTGVLTIANKKLVWLKTPDADESHWAPDGQSLVMSQATQGYTAISLTTTRGAIKRVLAVGGGMGEVAKSVWGATFSPDGSLVAYVEPFYWNDDRWTEDGEDLDIWTMDTNGGDRHRVTEGSGPAWSSR